MTAPTDSLEEDNDPISSDLSIEQWANLLGLEGKAVLTIDEAAVVLRLSERHTRDQIKAGAIPSIRFGRRVLVPVPMLLRSLLREPQGE